MRNGTCGGITKHEKGQRPDDRTTTGRRHRPPATCRTTPATCHTISAGVLAAMWLRAKARAAKAAWERILLDEFFLFSGGLEGAWSCADGWTEDAGTTEELVPAGGRRHPNEEHTSDKQRRCSAEREDARTGVLLEDSQVSVRHGSFVDSNVRAQHNGQKSSVYLCFVLAVLKGNTACMKGSMIPYCTYSINSV